VGYEFAKFETGESVVEPLFGKLVSGELNG
jgi:hypothetical protein